MRLLRAGVLFVGLLAAIEPLRAQISPGPLAKAHAKLEGASNCVECHGLRKEPMSQRCLACHKEVAWLVDRGRGLHAKSRNVPARECASCHPDHAGTDFELIDWGKGGRQQFDHLRAGWALDGKHAKVKCEDCHKAIYRTSPAAALSPRVTGSGWMGLETACISCHKRDDVHRNTLGDDCARCHDAVDWKKAVRFDHEKSKYPLTGKHADVACDKCHKAARLGLKPDADGRIVARYKPLPAAQCSACHADPHQGRVSAKCSDCHNTRDFKDVNRREFDHAATRYPLTGKHATVSCEGCHGVKLTRKTPPYARCADCHTDAHYGRATLAGKAVDCAACHRVEGFAPSTYTVAQHQMTSYALAGRHAAVSCALCHVASDTVVRVSPRLVKRRVQLRPSAASCASCHADAHQGELARAESKGVCSACHDERGWTPTTFTVARHAVLKLPLDGAHAPLACGKCHVAVRPAAAPRGQRPRTPVVPLRIAAACDACHVDPHGGRYSAGSARAPKDGCQACHDTRRWVPSTLAAARHGTFGFGLDGAHRAVPCRDCHKELGAPPSRTTLRAAATVTARLPFSTAPRAACTACHTDPHAGQFERRPRGGSCESCHDATRWLGAARFVHDRDSSFPLAGAHSRVPCAACHARVVQSGGGTYVRYRPLPLACEGCHADATTRKRP
ncbi:MAG: cytochrome c3 family protein [Gemmatimonadaceae bacterium]|nr:cytochrome c3 family protein [Gemmatimonadaceae bacterium]